MEFPIFKTKIKGQNQKFNLSDPKERKKYFQLKAGKEIEKIKNYLRSGHTFIAYLLGKKNSGKGTYSKLFIEAIGENNVSHVSIGDTVRKIHAELSDKKKKQEIIEFLEHNYRGYISVQEAIKALLSRDTKTLLPSELILALVKREISKMKKTALFVDGFPRDLDQISYSLFFRDLVDYRQDPDLFILINVPESVIDERIKYRRVCPSCHTPRGLKLQPTNDVRYDKKNKEFYLICDNPKCKEVRMVSKEGDELGIAPIRKRLNLDGKLMKQALSLYGVPKILLRNSIPVDKVEEYADDYEITPEYCYKYDPVTEKVEITEKPWTVHDDQNELCCSLLPPPVVVSMIKQMVEVLRL